MGMPISKDVQNQIEAAYDYRGHVTVTLRDGGAVEGFLFNRLYEHPQGGQSHYVDLILKNKDEKRRIAMSDIQSIALTGEDCAAGKSYEDYLAKQKASAKA